MGNLIKDIEVFDELLKAGVETKKYVGYKSWGQVLNTLAEETGKRLVQLPNGQVCEILSGVGTSSAGATTGLSTYGMAAVNVTETEILAGDAVITSSGEVITLGETTTGLVVSGTSDVATAGALGTTTACESGFMLTPKTALIAGVAGICGFAIGDAIAGKIAAELDGEDFDWGSDTIVGNLVNKLQDQILMRIEPGGKTSFDADLTERVYNELVKKGFFKESEKIFNPESFENGKTYTFNNLVSVKELANNQFNILKHVNFDALSGVTGFNERFSNLIEELINRFDESKLSGLGCVNLNIRLLRYNDDSLELSISFNLIRTEMTDGRYVIEKNGLNPEHPIKNFYFNTSYTRSEFGINSSGGTFHNNVYGYIKYRNNSFVSSYANIMGNNNYKPKYNDYIYGSYSDIPKSKSDKTLYQYAYENWNVGTFSQEEEKYKKRKFPDAKTPDPSKSLEENYPEWDNKKDTTSKPTDSDPNKKDEYRPGKINNNKKDPNNNDNNSQKDSQDGKNTNKDIKDDTDSGKEIIDDISDPEQDPSDPDDDPIGETPDVLIPINPISDSGFVSLYNPSGFELRQLSQYLWSDNFINNIKKLFQDPMDAIIGLHMIFGSPTTGEKTNIKVGFVDTGVTANKITAQYFTIDCGTVNVREYFKDARDYDFCNISIYLPFVGIQKLNSKDLMDASVRVLVTVDVVTGALLYEIDVTKKGLKQCLYTFSGNCAVQLPISAGSYSSAIANLIGIGAGIAGTVATGGALAPALISGIGSAAVNSHVDVQTSNSIGSNAGAMGIKKPYLIINRLSSYNANAYQKTQGYPSNKTAKIGSLKGVAKIKECHLEGIPATDEELEEIYTLLKQGVIL